jgi:hypothetical protein
MNWYKKTQLQETLPYFKELEEYGDYIPDETSLNSKLDSIGVTITSEINRGDSGIAYMLSNGDVLKITTNSQEGQVANYLTQNPHPSIINYKMVWKEGDLYFIIMEHIEQMISEIPVLKTIFDKTNQIINSANCYDVDCAYDILITNRYFKSLSYGIKNNILEYLKHLRSIPIPLFDFLNPNNIGLQNGKIKFFDIT